VILLDRFCNRICDKKNKKKRLRFDKKMWLQAQVAATHISVVTRILMWTDYPKEMDSAHCQCQDRRFVTMANYEDLRASWYIGGHCILRDVERSGRRKVWCDESSCKESGLTKVAYESVRPIG